MALPPFRWVGGKRWLVEEHSDLLPTAEEIAARGGVYREPFVGGGAVALARYAGRCPLILSDANGPLIRCYRTIRDEIDALVSALRSVASTYGREGFERARDGLNDYALHGIDEAVAVFVLLAWGFNGLWRVAKNGRINTTFGKPSKPGAIPKLFDEENLRAISTAIVGASICQRDFAAALGEAARGDFVFIDPPYEPASETADFTAYAGGWRVASPVQQGGLFGAEHVGTESDLDRLVACCRKLDTAGAEWALTNSDTPVTRRAFADWHITQVMAARSVSSKATTRGPVPEIIVRNYRRAG